MEEDEEEAVGEEGAGNGNGGEENDRERGSE